MGMKGSRGAAVCDKVSWCHSGMGLWMVLWFHRVVEFFKEGGSKLRTMQERDEFVIPMGGGLLGQLGWQGEEWELSESIKATRHLLCIVPVSL